MTSHKEEFEGRSTGEMDRLIRWALRDRVIGASPSPRVWERIRERAGRPTVWRLVGFRFSRVDAFLSAQVAAWMPQSERARERRDFCSTYLFDQYGLLLQWAS